jgi:GrpB-like predicted nucleotidyltransferase (UPF0157 family)
LARGESRRGSPFGSLAPGYLDNEVVPRRAEIVTFYDPPVPAGASPWVAGIEPAERVEVVQPDPIWSLWATELETRIRRALGWRVLCLSHVGSTAVPGLPAKPIIDLDLIVAEPNDEAAYVPELEAVDFELRVREPWWFSHRMLRAVTPKANLHVFGFDSPEPIKHRLFRDWLRANADDRDAYARIKQEAANVTNDRSESVMAYNAYKEQAIREIYGRAFIASGLLPI